MKQKPEIIIVHERVLESWLRDAGTLATFCALIGIGVYLESSAMQWVGALIGFTIVFLKASRHMGENRYNFDEARKKINQIEAEYK